MLEERTSWGKREMSGTTRRKLKTGSKDNERASAAKMQLETFSFGVAAVRSGLTRCTATVPTPHPVGLSRSRQTPDYFPKRHSAARMDPYRPLVQLDRPRARAIITCSCV